ncbi:hypothetical protein [Streptomyces sp. KN37]|uniref:hypothetical protein n=1 Tax=Streptomyces sp. KN37 TaxID=3090667 RepID=UPI002A755EF7|nr:hypothetical protein [Streptomyces sp. KN37]WPO75541.1 hypothetical protein R9806_35560 [Streptomyces sp. KN37]
MVLQYREPAGTELRKAMCEASARPFALTGELPFRAWSRRLLWRTWRTALDGMPEDPGPAAPCETEGR